MSDFLNGFDALEPTALSRQTSWPFALTSDFSPLPTGTASPGSDLPGFSLEAPLGQNSGDVALTDFDFKPLEMPADDFNLDPVSMSYEPLYPKSKTMDKAMDALANARTLYDHPSINPKNQFNPSSLMETTAFLDPSSRGSSSSSSSSSRSPGQLTFGNSSPSIAHDSLYQLPSIDSIDVSSLDFTSPFSMEMSPRVDNGFYSNNLNSVDSAHSVTSSTSVTPQLAFPNNHSSASSVASSSKNSSRKSSSDDDEFDHDGDVRQPQKRKRAVTVDEKKASLERRRQKHNEVEIRRRQQINDHFDELKQLISYNNKHQDKDSILQAVIAHINASREQVRALEDMKSRRLSSKQFLERHVLEAQRKAYLKMQHLPVTSVAFTKAFRAASVPMVVANVTVGGMVDLNDAFLEWSGHKKERLLGAPCYSLTHPDDLDFDMFEKIMQNMVSGKQKLALIKKRIMMADSTYQKVTSVFWITKQPETGDWMCVCMQFPESYSINFDRPLLK